jgi:hypothetical protein
MWRLRNGPDGNNSLWHFINLNAEAPLHAASFDIEGNVTTSDLQEATNAFAESFKSNFQRALNLFPCMRRNTGLDATSATPELSELHISATNVHNLLSTPVNKT